MQYFYIHGFGTTGKGSTKYKYLTKFCSANKNTAFALEWKPDQANVIEVLKNQLDEFVNWELPVCLIGSSTGGNFALQLLKSIQSKQIQTSCILINPFVVLSQTRIENPYFSKQLAQQMKLPAREIKNLKILLATNDEILNAEITQEFFINPEKIISNSEWNHSLSNVSEQDFINLLTD